MRRVTGSWNGEPMHIRPITSTCPCGDPLCLMDLRCVYTGRLKFGDLAEFSVLDTRQYRSDQPCGDGNKPQCEVR